jgi:hypothetical protein
MFQLIYASHAKHAFDEMELISLLKAARAKNLKLNITGMLLYKDGIFMQLLEGDETEVRKLFSTIKHDNRHEKVVVLFEKSCDHSVLSDWSMGFLNLESDYAKSIPGYTTFLDTPLSAQIFVDDPTMAMQFLYIFKFAKLDGL